MQDGNENIDDGFLNELQAGGGFTTPPAYFEKLEGRILDRIAAEKGPRITGAEGGFQVPEAYFDSLEKKLMQKVLQPVAKVIPLYRRPVFKMAVGIAAAFIMVMLWFYPSEQTPAYRETSWQHLSADELESHVVNSDISPELITEVVFQPATQGNATATENKEIEQYLLEQADEEAIIDAL
jgi:hypothetical protein